MAKRKVLAFTAFSLLTGLSVQASHISGGEITYTCLGGDQYQVTLTLFRDCAGIDMATSETINFSSPCGNLTLSVPLTFSEEISQLCPSEIGNSACNFGTLPGMELYEYSGVITLPPCDFWTMSWSNCCRNDAIDNLVGPGTLDTYLQATLNNEDFPCDNSPIFNNVPIPYVCVGDPVLYGFGVSEADGDSIGYSFISAMEAGGTPVPYQAGYTFDQPIPGITLSIFSGLMTFTSAVAGNFVVTVLVTQYDADGNVIGTVMRDIQFVVIPCVGNNSPDPTSGVITNFTGTATQVGNYNIEMCESDNFCFDFTVQDPDVTDTLTLTDNIATVLPGAVVSYAGLNPVSGTICWTAPPGSSGFNTFIIAATDNACTVPAFQTYVYTVNVLTRTNAGPDLTICGPQVANLGAQGGAVFDWTVMNTTPPGDPIVIGVNFSCSPCQYPIADPAVTTTYIVQSDLSGACINSDTVTVNVVPNFTFLATQSDTVLCLGETVQFDVTTNPPGVVSDFIWTPAVGLSATNIANPVGAYDLPGTYDYTVDMTSDDGCYHQDTSLQVIVVPAFAPEFTVSQQDEFICEGESTQFLVELDNTVPSTCGANFAGCTTGVITQVDIGAGTDFGTTTSWPAIFGQWYTGNRNQIFFTAAELQAMGFVGGTITELSWNVNNIPPGANSTFYDFEIKMGCTTQSEPQLGVWIDGLTVVHPADTIDIVVGWNTFVLSPGFNWDGVSNLVIDVCTDRFAYFGTDYTQNSANYYTVTSTNSVHEWHSDQGQVCTDAPGVFMIESLSANRPNTRFTYCSGINEDLVTYTWVPPTGLSDPSSPNPTVTPTYSPATYTVQVGDSAYGCYNEASLTVTWWPPAGVSFYPDPAIGVAPVTIDFVNTSASGVGNFSWVFGDGNDTTGISDPNNEYLVPGVYYVTLTGYDTTGCMGTYTDSVVILSTPIVEIPNVFSPNGEQGNETFAFMEFKGFADFKMRIFNRWGMVVHETTNAKSDGTVWEPKSDIPDGTYYYEFIGVGVNGDEIKKQGHVTLLR